MMSNQKIVLMLDAYDKTNKLVSRLSYLANPGYNVWRIHTSKLGNIPLAALELYPENNEAAELVFFFSDLLSFHHDSNFYIRHKDEIIVGSPAEKVKCVIWDLDNTLWDGIIGECGVEKIVLREEVVKVIKELDCRGVLQSVCSKNDYDLAWKGICRFGLEQFFLYPQINWQPKSTNIRKLGKLLNINTDTFALVDDSEIERQEIAEIIPNMRVYPDTLAESLLTYSEFDLPVTEESKNRRRYYMDEIKRDFLYAQSAEDSNYEEFIRKCNIWTRISPCLSEADIRRCYELIQRTNQLNASGNRISMEEFSRILAADERCVLKVFCKDNYGEYGIVGCLILKEDFGKIVCSDFVLSCRVAKKKIEEAVIFCIMEFYGIDMDIVYYPTDRNRVLLEELTSSGGNYLEEKHVVQFKKGCVANHNWINVAYTDESL